MEDIEYCKNCIYFRVDANGLGSKKICDYVEKELSDFSDPLIACRFFLCRASVIDSEICRNK